MGDKYIIELEDKPFHKEDGDFLYRAKGFNSLVFDMTGIGKLTPYTEPDLEQVRADAYLKGLNDGQGVILESTQNNAFNNGYKKCLEDMEQVRIEAFQEGKKQAKVQAELDVCHDIEKVAKENYKAGLSDAWEAARKIWKYDTTTLRAIFGEGIMRMDWFMNFTAAEAIEKLKAYEQEHEEIKVGDEVESTFGKGFVVKVEKSHISYIYDDGSWGYNPTAEVAKTGRHFPEVAAVLEKMRENT